MGGLGGFLGFDYSALPVLFAAYGVHESEYQIYMDKILILTTVASKYWNADTKKNSSKK